jgi:Spy/CpxP family protein refolding chaperone
MTKIKAILVVSFVLTFAAGGAAGLLLAHLDHSHRGPSWLEAELNLTDAQRDQMRTIWSEVMGSITKQRSEQRDALRQERDKAILALLTDEQRPRYDAILTEFSRKDGEMAEQRKQAMDEAVKRTKEILTPEQAAKYDDLMQKQREKGQPRGGRRGSSPDGTPPPPPHGGE